MRNSHFSHAVAVVAFAGLGVLLTASSASAQCMAGGRGNGSMIPAGRGARMAGQMSAGGGLNQLMMMASAMRQAQMAQQMNLMRQQMMLQQSSLSRQNSVTNAAPIIERLQLRPTTATSNVQTLPTTSRQERLREAIRKQKEDREARRATSAKANRPRRSRLIVFSGSR